ncbi:hypothetical protein B0H11DRAFT_2281716 [Mycena galericulata]|nr:hypothetical protein B0H11DRAFT_2281716 [Mycena galericulata]
MIPSKADTFAALYARLEELESDIEAQDEVLRKLHRTRSAVRRQLNDLRDPMALLPREISSEILIHCLPTDEYPRPSDLSLFLEICTLWTEVALSTTGIWATLRIYIPDDMTAEFRDIFAQWLLRSQGRPISLSLTGSTIADPVIMDIVGSHAHHLHSLRVPSLPYLHAFLGGTMFLSLEYLDVGTGSEGDDRFYIDQFMQVLQSVPNLRVCNLGAAPQGVDDADEVPHAHLERLTVVGDDYFSHIFQYLTFPGLVHLNISREAAAAEDLISFFTRSAPPLRKFILNTTDVDQWEPDSFQECLRLVPSLTCLEVGGAMDIQDDLIDILFEAPSDTFLPNLATLTVSSGFPHAAWYKRLVAMLSRRHATLRAFRIEVPPYMTQYHKLDEEDKRALGALIRGGMEIDMGSVVNSSLVDFSDVGDSDSDSE